MNPVDQTELLTAAQMQAFERAAMNEGAVVGRDLMERAGGGVVRAMFDTWPDLVLSSYHVVILCGPGNNGGDGFVIARLLKEQGWTVDVHLYGDAKKLPPDARLNHDRWCDLGDVRSWDAEAVAASTADVFVDAVFGAGLTRAPAQDISGPLIALSRKGRLVAVDAPTGLCMDSGRPLSADAGVPVADLTTTFHAPRVGQYLAEGPAYCGRLVIVPIGLPETAPVGSRCRSLNIDFPTERDRATLVRNHGTRSHKYNYGHALVLSGPPGRGGAARLAARGAIRVGAGLVTVACPAPALSEHAAHLDAIMCRSFDTTGDLVEILSDERLNALCLGPGLGLDEAARGMVTAVLAAGRATVLDADALTSHADDPASLFDQLHSLCVLTPHGGEFARLFPDIAHDLATDPAGGPAMSKLDATRCAAARAGATVVFKGPDTVIATPDGQAFVHAAAYGRAAPWLATAGAGDVLAGLIAGLMASGHAPATAASLAVWLHVDAALRFGPGLISEDLPELLPEVLAALTA